MKRLSFLFILSIIFNSTVWAQATVIIPRIPNPAAVCVVGNNIYFGALPGSIYIKNLNNSNPGILFDQAAGTYRAIERNNKLYYSGRSTSRGYIIEIDLANNNSRRVLLDSSIYSPNGLAFRNNELYFSDSRCNCIYKINPSLTNPSPILVATGFIDPTGMDFLGSKLYVAEIMNNTISVVDFSSTNPSPRRVIDSSLNRPTEVRAYQNKLLISAFFDNRIVQMDVSGTTPTITNIVSSISLPAGIHMEGTDMYVASYGSDRVLRYSLGTTSLDGTEEAMPVFDLFPNPAKDRIQLNGDLSLIKNYQVYDSNGRLVKQEDMTNSGHINISEYPEGLYHFQIQLKDGRSISKKFIKL